MIAINGFEKEFVYDLNVYSQDNHILNVMSISENGNNLPWGIMFISNENICANKKGDKLILEFDYINIILDAFIILRNSINEQIKIKIIPNIEATCERVYTFKIADFEAKGFDAKFNIISLRNETQIPWKCIYMGQPFPYTMTPSEFSGNTEVNLKLLFTPKIAIKSLFKFEQPENGEIIKLILNNTQGGIEKAD